MPDQSPPPVVAVPGEPTEMVCVPRLLPHHMAEIIADYGERWMKRGSFSSWDIGELWVALKAAAPSTHVCITKEQMQEYQGAEAKGFQRGIKVAFDTLQIQAANNWHPNEEQQKVRDIQNEALLSAADDLLHLAPEHEATWRSLTEAFANVERMKEALELALVRLDMIGQPRAEDEADDMDIISDVRIDLRKALSPASKTGEG